MEVAKLKRTRVGSYRLPFSMKEGDFAELSARDAKAVLEAPREDGEPMQQRRQQYQ